MSVVIGVDPGTTGAISLFIDGQLADLADMPTANKQVVAAALAHDLRRCAEAGFDERRHVERGES